MAHLLDPEAARQRFNEIADPNSPTYDPQAAEQIKAYGRKLKELGYPHYKTQAVTWWHERQVENTADEAEQEAGDTVTANPEEASKPGLLSKIPMLGRLMPGEDRGVTENESAGARGLAFANKVSGNVVPQAHDLMQKLGVDPHGALGALGTLATVTAAPALMVPNALLSTAEHFGLTSRVHDDSDDARANAPAASSQGDLAGDAVNAALMAKTGVDVKRALQAKLADAAPGLAAKGADALDSAAKVVEKAPRVVGGALGMKAGAAVGHPVIGAGAGASVGGKALAPVASRLSEAISNGADALRARSFADPGFSGAGFDAANPPLPDVDLASSRPMPAPFKAEPAGGKPIDFAKPINDDGTSPFPVDLSKTRRPQTSHEPIDLDTSKFDEFMGGKPSGEYQPVDADAPEADKPVGDVDALSRAHARADALPKDRGALLRQILEENGITDHDSAGADAAYQAWKAGGRKGPKPTSNLRGMLDSFDASKDGNAPQSLLEAFEKQTKGARTYRDIQPAVDAVGDALGVKLRLPDDVVARHVAQDAALNDANAQHESVDDIVRDMWGSQVRPMPAPAYDDVGLVGKNETPNPTPDDGGLVGSNDAPDPGASVSARLKAAVDKPLQIPDRVLRRRGTPDWQLNPKATGITDDVSQWPDAAQREVARLEEGGTNPRGGKSLFRPEGLGKAPTAPVPDKVAEDLASQPAPEVESTSDVGEALRAKLARDPAQSLVLQAREAGVGQRFNPKVEADKMAAMQPDERQAYMDVLARMHGKAATAPLAKRYALDIPDDAPKYSTQPAHVRSASMEGAHTVHQQATGKPWGANPIDEMSGQRNSVDDAEFLRQFEQEMASGKLPSGKDMERYRVLSQIRTATGG